MPSVFIDIGSGDHDLTINSPSNWTIHSAIMPNGDNAAEKTSQNGSKTFGVIGTGMTIVEVLTALEFWIRPHSDWGTSQTIIEAADINHGNQQWLVQTNGITGGLAGLYISTHRGIAITPQVSIDDWHHFVVHMYTDYVQTTSSTGWMNSYIDGAPGPSNSVGSNSFRPGGAGAGCGIHIGHENTVIPADLGKVCWYIGKNLSGIEVISHYTNMVAA